MSSQGEMLQLIILVLLKASVSTLGKQQECKTTGLFICKDGETCEQIASSSTEGVCTCITNYTRNSDHICVPIDSKDTFSTGPSASAIAVGLSIPILALVLIASLYFAARRYKWLHRFREQAHQLHVRNNDQLGLVVQDDDPPLT